MRISTNGVVVLAISSLLVACDREVTAPAGSGVEEVRPELAATTAPWSLKAPLPKARSNAKAATVNGIVYVIGGMVSTPEAGLQVRARVDAYDVVSNTWTSKKALPEALIPHGATSIEGRIYVAGGWTHERLSKRLYVYNPGTDTWTRKADMPFTIDRSAGHQGMIDGKLYVYAGVTVKADGLPGPHRFFRYDPAGNTWTTLNRPSYSRRGGAAGVIDGKLYLVGGTLSTTQKGASDVHVYDPTTGWTTRALGLHGLDGGLAHAPIGDKLYIVGTDSRDDCTYDVSKVYDPVSNTLSPFSSLPPRASRATGVAAKGQFLVLGGADIEPDDMGCAWNTGKVTEEVWAYTP
jgi:N-acetylneuraminic acid mutarotase